jgi:mono/diheme cytochrome c family protein
MKKISIALFVLLSSTMISAHADVDSAHKLANKYLGIAKAINPEYKDFSVEDGKAFFNEKFTVKGKQIACASCHTANPADPGKHIVTGKPIRPLSPVINAKRFADLDKVEKNFTNHCNDIISRDCTAQEKANFIAYLLTADKP